MWTLSQELSQLSQKQPWRHSHSTSRGEEVNLALVLVLGLLLYASLDAYREALLQQLQLYQKSRWELDLGKGYKIGSLERGS